MSQESASGLSPQSQHALEVWKYLEGFRMTQYFQPFIDAGWDDLEALWLMTDADLKNYGVVDGHRRKLLADWSRRSVDEARANLDSVQQLAANPSTPAPTFTAAPAPTSTSTSTSAASSSIISSTCPSSSTSTSTSTSTCPSSSTTAPSEPAPASPAVPSSLQPPAPTVDDATSAVAALEAAGANGHVVEEDEVDQGAPCTTTTTTTATSTATTTAAAPSPVLKQELGESTLQQQQQQQLQRFANAFPDVPMLVQEDEEQQPKRRPCEEKGRRRTMGRVKEEQEDEEREEEKDEEEEKEENEEEKEQQKQQQQQHQPQNQEQQQQQQHQQQDNEGSTLESSQGASLPSTPQQEPTPFGEVGRIAKEYFQVNQYDGYKTRYEPRVVKTGVQHKIVIRSLAKPVVSKTVPFTVETAPEDPCFHHDVTQTLLQCFHICIGWARERASPDGGKAEAASDQATKKRWSKLLGPSASSAPCKPSSSSSSSSCASSAAAAAAAAAADALPASMAPRVLPTAVSRPGKATKHTKKKGLKQVLRTTPRRLSRTGGIARHARFVGRLVGSCAKCPRSSTPPLAATLIAEAKAATAYSSTEAAAEPTFPLEVKDYPYLRYLLDNPRRLQNPDPGALWPRNFEALQRMSALAREEAQAALPAGLQLSKALASGSLSQNEQVALGGIFARTPNPESVIEKMLVSAYWGRRVVAERYHLKKGKKARASLAAANNSNKNSNNSSSNNNNNSSGSSQAPPLPTLEATKKSKKASASTHLPSKKKDQLISGGDASRGRKRKIPAAAAAKTATPATPSAPSAPAAPATPAAATARTSRAARKATAPGVAGRKASTAKATAASASAKATAASAPATTATATATTATTRREAKQNTQDVEAKSAARPHEAAPTLRAAPATPGRERGDTPIPRADDASSPRHASASDDDPLVSL